MESSSQALLQEKDKLRQLSNWQEQELTTHLIMLQYEEMEEGKGL